MTEIINIRNYKLKDYIYGGRGSILGNPYEIGIDGNRDTVCNRFDKWFDFCMRDPVYRNYVLSLRNKKIGCFCVDDKGTRCHLMTIKKWLDNLE